MENFSNQDQENQPDPQEQAPDIYPSRIGRSHFARRKHPWLWPVILMLLAIVGIGLLWLHSAYNNAQNTFQKTYEAGSTHKLRNVSHLIKRDKPFSVLLLGTDTGALGRHDKGRTDTIILASVNPKKKSIYLTSIPRDTRVTVPGDNQQNEKINAAYTIGGPSTAAATVQKLLDVPVDFYAIINMGGLEKMVNSVNGVTVDPPLSFHYGAANVTRGDDISLHGKAALAYARMRHQDPQGDYGRQRRQRQVLQKLIMKGMKITSLPRYKQILNSLNGNLKTDIKFNDMVSIRARYGVATHHLHTRSLREKNAVINGIDYEIPTKAELKKMSKRIRRSLGLKSTSDQISDNDIEDSSTNIDDNDQSN